MGEEAKTENSVDAEKSLDSSEALQAAEQPEQLVPLSESENPDTGENTEKAKLEETPQTSKASKSVKTQKSNTAKKDRPKQDAENTSSTAKTDKDTASAAVTAPKKKPSFKVGQNVVYPLQGVGKIRSQSKRKFKGKQINYYTIYIGSTDMTLMLPVSKVHELGMRPIVPKADAECALKSMSDKNEPLTSDWKLRYQNNLDLLKEGGVMQIATVVRSLYHRSKVKELPILERKLYDNALKLMIDEISLAMNREKEEIEDLLHMHLESSNS